MAHKTFLKSDLAQKINSSLQFRNTLLLLGFVIPLTIAGILAIMQPEETMASSYPISDDQDQDDIPNWEDFDDDNDGIPDLEEGYDIKIIENFEGAPGNQTTGYDAFANAFPSGSSQLANSKGTSGYFKDPITLTGQILASEGTAYAGFHSSEDYTQEVVRVNLAPTEMLLAGFAYDMSFLAYQMNLGTIIATGVFNNSGHFDFYGIQVGTSNPTSAQQNNTTTISAVSGIDLLGRSDLIDNPTAWESYTISFTAAATYDRILIFPVSEDFVLTGTHTAGKSTFLGIDKLAYNRTTDFDLDGIPNYLDLDSDNDGIPDIVEAGGSDPDGDGQVAYATAGDPTTMVDVDGDGLWDTVDDQDSGSGGGEVTDGTALPLTNTDGQGNPDYLDIDADDDGIVDNTEAQSSSGYIAPSGVDTDGDGIDDAYDIDCQPCGAITGTSIVPVNTGGGIEPDYQDTDTDGDGIADEIEGHDTNGDGIVDGNDSPTANTGLAGGTTDSDGDGLLDGFDNDTADPDPTNGSMNPNSHPDEQGVTSERDWREDSSLPVEWLSFEAALNGNDAQLRWSTAAELNSDFYQIERSVDGLLFESVGKVSANGTTTDESDYQYTDANVGTSGSPTLMYRLRQVDFNGTFDYSNTVQLDMSQAIPSISLELSPNPVPDVLTISVSHQGATSISIINVAGQEIYSESLTPDNTTQTFQVPVADWPAGIYHALVKGREGRVAKQFIIQR